VLTVALLVLAAVPPEVDVVRPDARGCGEVRVNGRAVAGAAPGLCVTQAAWTGLEGGLVVLVVRAPHRFEAAVRNRVFVYRLEGRRLVPRFLGSGFRGVEVIRVVPGGDRLRLEVAREDGPTVMQCQFDGFPLVCEASLEGKQ
jgi:hypothetical protein